MRFTVVIQTMLCNFFTMSLLSLGFLLFGAKPLLRLIAAFLGALSNFGPGSF